MDDVRAIAELKHLLSQPSPRPKAATREGWDQVQRLEEAIKLWRRPPDAIIDDVMHEVGHIFLSLLRDIEISSYRCAPKVGVSYVVTYEPPYQLPQSPRADIDAEIYFGAVAVSILLRTPDYVYKHDFLEGMAKLWGTTFYEPWRGRRTEIAGNGTYWKGLSRYLWDNPPQEPLRSAEAAVLRAKELLIHVGAEVRYFLPAIIYCAAAITKRRAKTRSARCYSRGKQLRRLFDQSMRACSFPKTKPSPARLGTAPRPVDEVSAAHGERAACINSGGSDPNQHLSSDPLDLDEFINSLPSFTLPSFTAAVP